MIWTTAFRREHRTSPVIGAEVVWVVFEHETTPAEDESSFQQAAYRAGDHICARLGVEWTR